MTEPQAAGSSASAIRSDRPTVFIHTNDRQMLGAIVSRYSMKRNAANPDEFDVHLIEHADYAFFEDYEGREYLRGGTSRVWRNDDLQSFTPLRFMPPELMATRARGRHRPGCLRRRRRDGAAVP